MLTEKDIAKLISGLEKVFVTKTDFLDFKDEYRKDFSSMHNMVDHYGTKADVYFQEMLVLSRQFDRHEKWIKKIADKIGVKLEI